jgi:DNA repair protein SbcD/Mre11
MKILHTSDWHLGRSFHRVGMLDAQAGFVDHLVEVVRAERVDVVLVAGDVYDRALPGVDVVAVLDDALERLTAAGATVVLCSGNHDSARRLGFAARLLEAARVHVRTDPARCADPVLLTDAAGPVALYPLPYLEPALVADTLGCERSHVGVLAAAVAAVRRDLADRPRGTRSVLAAHAFVVGGRSSDSERDISVGGVPSVPLSVFAGVDYVALGHLHGRQQLAGSVRYSGSPLAYSFSEARHLKGSWLVELGPHGLQRVDAVPAPVPRRLAVLSGELAELLRDPALEDQERAWCQVTLTDPERPADAMRRLRGRFPHTLELRFAPGVVAGVGSPGPLVLGRVVPGRVVQRPGPDDLAACCGFLEYVRGRRPLVQEVALLREAVEACRRADPEELGPAARRLAARLAAGRVGAGVEVEVGSGTGVAVGTAAGRSDRLGPGPDGPGEGGLEATG